MSSSSSSSSSTSASRNAPVVRLDVDEPILKVTLLSSDRTPIVVEEKVARQSELVNKTLNEKKDPNDREVFLELINTELLKKVVQYLEFHATTPARVLTPPVRTSNLRELVIDFDYDFINVEPTQIWDYVLAANFMSIKPMLDLCLAKLATLIRGKKTEELRVMFQIANDFTPEEEAQLIEENKWAFTNA